MLCSLVVMSTPLVSTGGFSIVSKVKNMRSINLSLTFYIIFVCIFVS